MMAILMVLPNVALLRAAAVYLALRYSHQEAHRHHPGHHRCSGLLTVRRHHVQRGYQPVWSVSGLPPRDGGCRLVMVSALLHGVRLECGPADSQPETVSVPVMYWWIEQM